MIGSVIALSLPQLERMINEISTNEVLEEGDDVYSFDDLSAEMILSRRMF